MKSSKIKTITGRILFFIAVCFIFIMPILSFLRMSLTTDGGFGLQNYVDMLHEERTVKAVRNTLIISTASTVIAVAAGSFFAFLTAYTNVKRKKLLELLVLAPYIIPSYIITLSWSSPAAMSAVIVFIVFFVYSRVALVKKKDEEDAKRPKAQLDQCSYI